MKKVNVKTIKSNYTFRGFLIGLVLFMAFLFFVLEVFKDNGQSPSFLKLYMSFPSLWLATFLPIGSAILGYFVANNFVQVIRNQKKHLKKESKRSQFVLDFVDNLREGNFQVALPLN